MKQLLKYIMVVNVICILFFGVISFVSYKYENYKATRYTQEEINIIHARGEPVALPTGPWFILRERLSSFFIYIVSILVVILSGLYQYKNPTIGSYAKSLIIPISSILCVILCINFIPISFTQGVEGGMIWVIFLMQSTITFSMVVIVNLIIYFLRHKYSHINSNLS